MQNIHNDFLFAVHFHQPFGNFDHIIESTFRRSYRPLIDVISRFPDVKTTIHLSGPLLLWLEKNHSEYIEKIHIMVKKGQLELIGGTYSECLLAVVDDDVRIVQLEKYRELINRLFGEKIVIKGLWLTERVWMPEIIPSIIQNGYEYVFLDEDIIKKGGRSDFAKIFEHEYKDLSIKIIPIDKYLRYNFPFRSPENIIEHIQKHSFCVHADDGEKFGDWPGMYDFLYEKEEYIFNFFKACEEKKIKFIHPDTILKKNSDNIEKIHIPYSSYDGMNKWSMFTEDIMEICKKFSTELIEEYSYIFHSGNFFNFFIKYPESNSIYRKNKYFCRMFRHIPEVYEELLRSQCCCGYWHGVFGGIYLPHLRDAINLGNIAAERQLSDGICEIEDLLILKNNNMAVTIEKKAGSLQSIDLFNKNINIINAFSRKPEFYHKDIDSEIFYDNSHRNSFIDRIVSEELDSDKYIKRMYGDQSDIFLKDYNLTGIYNGDSEKICAECQSECFIKNKIVDLKISKEFHLNDKSLIADYKWSTQDIISDSDYLTLELNFHNIFGIEPQVIYGKEFILSSSDNIKLMVNCNKAYKIILMPVYTVSNNHQKIENIQQCYTAVIQIPLNNKNCRITITIESSD